MKWLDFAEIICDRCVISYFRRTFRGLLRCYLRCTVQEYCRLMLILFGILYNFPISFSGLSRKTGIIESLIKLHWSTLHTCSQKPLLCRKRQYFSSQPWSPCFEKFANDKPMREKKLVCTMMYRLQFTATRYFYMIVSILCDRNPSVKFLTGANTFGVWAIMSRWISDCRVASHTYIFHSTHNNHLQ